MIATIPISTSMIESVSGQLSQLEQLFLKESVSFNSFNETIRHCEDLSSTASFYESPDQVVFLQTAMLLVLSMLGGVLVPCINLFSDFDNRVRITWDNGIVDQFTYGQCDDDFLRFSSYFQDRLSSKPQHRQDVPVTILFGMYQFILNHIEILTALRKRIGLLMENKDSLLSLLHSEMNRDLLFILLSTLPQDQLNAFFLNIQQYFPDDIQATSADNKSINVVSFLQSPSSDISFLIQKIRIFLDLYFSKDLPQVRDAARSKGIPFLKQIFMNDDVYLNTRRVLFEMKELHIDLRMKFFVLYKEFFERLDVSDI